MKNLTRKKNNKIKTANDYANKCKDKAFADKMINDYKTDASSAVKSIINMSRAVEAIDKRYRDSEISSDDLNYFCLSVGLKKLSSQFRKFVCIGRHADKFENYIEVMPNAISVLYEITTLDAVIFETLIEKNFIHQNLSLRQLKQLAQKPSKKSQTKSENIQRISIDFDLDKLTEKSKILLIATLKTLKIDNSFTVNMPNSDDFSNYINKELSQEDVLDAEVKFIN